MFIEDLLPDNLVPAGLLQRRFSRRRLLREARDHRHAIRTLKTYIGNDPPPSYQPVTAQRRCAVIGAAQMGQARLLALTDFLAKRHYRPIVIAGRAQVPNEIAAEEFVQSAALCIAVVERLTPAEYYLLGVARAALTPSECWSAAASSQILPGLVSLNLRTPSLPERRRGVVPRKERGYEAGVVSARRTLKSLGRRALPP